MTDSQTREPRSQVLFRYTQQALRHSGLCMRKLASRIADAYMAQVAAPERIVDFHTGTTIDQLDKAERANAQLVDRITKGVVKMPADLEEAWVSALPEPWRADCSRELARRYGYLAARAPDGGAINTAIGLADLAREFSDTVGSLAPILADGLINSADAPHLKRALKESTDLMAAIATLQQQLAAALPEGAGDHSNVKQLRA